MRRANVIVGGFIKSYISWEFVRLTVNSHITAPGTIKAYAMVKNPIIGNVEESNSKFNFNNAAIAKVQKVGLASVKAMPMKPITVASAMDKVVD